MPLTVGRTTGIQPVLEYDRTACTGRDQEPMPSLKIVTALGLPLVFTQPLWGQQEAAVEAGTTVAKETAQTAGTVLTKLKQGLVEGDVNALNELVGQSLVPAGVALVILVVGYFVASFLGRVIGGSLSKRVDLTFGKFFGRMLKTASWRWSCWVCSVISGSTSPVLPPLSRPSVLPSVWPCKGRLVISPPA